jgi:hypothetical protein
VDAGFSREFFDAATAGVLDEDAPVIGATGVVNREFEGPKRCAMDIRDASFADKETRGRFTGCGSAELKGCALGGCSDVDVAFLCFWFMCL